MVTTSNLTPAEALALSDEEGQDYGNDSDDQREEERREGHRGGGGDGKAVRNWHVDAVGEWKAKRALIRKRKEKEEKRKQKAAAKAAAVAAKKKDK